MCSAPKGSTTRRRHIKKCKVSHSDYEEYARMVRSASAVYDRIEKENTKQKELLASQKPTITEKQFDNSRDENKSHFNIFSSVKTFLLKPVF